MALPNRALVLVVDGRKLLFRNHGDRNQIDLRTEAHDYREDLRTARSRATRRGDQAEPGLRPPALTETDFHQQDKDRWAKDAADELKKRALRNDFDALAIIAPPKSSACFARSCTRRSSGASS